MIPSQLQIPDYRFIPLKTGKDSKHPIELNWQGSNNYGYNDPKIQNVNYGVVCGYGGLRVLDIDFDKIADDLKDKLKTFAVQTGKGGVHFYFISVFDKNIKLENHIGELRCKAQFVVGANSIHPNGQSYKIINNAPITQIIPDELIKIIQPYVKADLSPKEEAREDTISLLKDYTTENKEMPVKLLPDRFNAIYLRNLDKPIKRKRELYHNEEYLRKEQKKKPTYHLYIDGFNLNDGRPHNQIMLVLGTTSTLS